MLMREIHAQETRMRRMAAEAVIAPDRAAAMIQPFIDKHKSLRLAMDRSSTHLASSHPLRHARHADIVDSALDAGRDTQRARLKGIAFHNGYLKALSLRAGGFGYRGFVECGAVYMGTGNATDEVWGRVDVAWATGREPEVIFEIDSTVKAASLWKLQQAQVPHKYWIYFGKDIWGFKTFLRKHDPAGHVTGIVLPRAWKP